MKALFVSDIHLNLRKDKEWEINRFRKLFEFIKDYNSEILILGGDIFDFPTPNIDEISLFYNEILKIDKQIYIISGNHCELSKNECVFDKLPELNYTYFDVTFEPIKLGKINVYFVSHHRLNQISKIQQKSGFNLLISHIRCDLGVVKEEYNLRKLSKYWDYVVLGDIHIPYKPYDNIEYCGSPYTIQYEQKRETGVLEIDLDNFKTTFISTSWLPQRIKLELDFKEFDNFLKSVDNYNLYKVIVNVENQNIKSNKDNVKVIANKKSSTKKVNDIIIDLEKHKNINLLEQVKLFTKQKCNNEDFKIAEGYFDKIANIVNIKKGE